jgi:hypothetical protein
MKRRSFLTLLTTLFAWVSMRPKLDADAINGSLKTAKWPESAFKPEPEPTVVLYRLFDGDRFIEERRHEPCCVVGRRVVFITKVARNTRVRVGLPGQPRVSYEETVFKPRQMHMAMRFDKQYNYTARVHYCDYESGPKWWAAPRPELLPGERFTGDCCNGINGSHEQSCVENTGDTVTCWQCGTTNPAEWPAIWSSRGSRCFNGCEPYIARWDDATWQ